MSKVLVPVTKGVDMEGYARFLRGTLPKRPPLPRGEGPSIMNSAAPRPQPLARNPFGGKVRPHLGVSTGYRPVAKVELSRGERYFAERALRRDARIKAFEDRRSAKIEAYEQGRKAKQDRSIAALESQRAARDARVDAREQARTERLASRPPARGGVSTGYHPANLLREQHAAFPPKPPANVVQMPTQRKVVSPPVGGGQVLPFKSPLAKSQPAYGTGNVRGRKVTGDDSAIEKADATYTSWRHGGRRYDPEDRRTLRYGVGGTALAGAGGLSIYHGSRQVGRDTKALAATHGAKLPKSAIHITRRSAGYIGAGAAAVAGSAALVHHGTKSSSRRWN